MYYKDVLPNGLRLITEEIPHVHSAVIGIWVGTGSRHEDKEIHGVSHFLEHMLFKGTKNRTAKQIAETLEAVGGQLNAFTSKEVTCYYAKVLHEHFDLATDVLSDMFFNSLFLETEINKEKNVILEEIKMYEDTPDDLVHDVFSNTLWHDHPLGQPVIGTNESVEKLTREQLVAYNKSRYVPKNVVISVVGKIKRQQVLEKIQSIFAGFSGELIEKKISEPKVNNSATFVTRDIEQVHLCLGTPGLYNQHPNIYSLHVLNNILGGGLSSRLFQDIREERGLAYSIYSYHSGYSNAGLFGVYAGTSRQNFEVVLELILKQIADIKKNGITKDELERTKQQVKGSILLSLENVSHRMSSLGKSEISYGRIVTPDEIVESIMKVTNESVIEVAQQMFKPENFALAVVGPDNIAVDFKELIIKNTI